MSNNNVLDTLGQVGPSAAGEVFRDWLRGEMRSLIVDILAEEVTELCAPAQINNPSLYFPLLPPFVTSRMAAYVLFSQ